MTAPMVNMKGPILKIADAITQFIFDQYYAAIQKVILEPRSNSTYVVRIFLKWVTFVATITHKTMTYCGLAKSGSARH